MFTILWYNKAKKGGVTMENYKVKIIDFIEGRTAPETFYTWFESNPQVLDMSLAEAAIFEYAFKLGARLMLEVQKDT